MSLTMRASHSSSCGDVGGLAQNKFPRPGVEGIPVFGAAAYRAPLLVDEEGDEEAWPTARLFVGEPAPETGERGMFAAGRLLGEREEGFERT